MPLSCRPCDGFDAALQAGGAMLKLPPLAKGGGAAAAGGAAQPAAAGDGQGQEADADEDEEEGEEWEDESDCSDDPATMPGAAAHAKAD